MLTGKTAIITGANRGIGLAAVEVFAEQGAQIWACARTQSDEFEDKLGEISGRNAVMARPVYFDVTDEDAVKNAVKMIGKKSGSVDILVNNAGISAEKLFGMTSPEMMMKTMKVNFMAQVHLAQLVSRYMIKAGGGSIVNVASVAGMESEQGGALLMGAARRLSSLRQKQWRLNWVPMESGQILFRPDLSQPICGRHAAVK